jgi:hypothetical protein
MFFAPRRPSVDGEFGQGSHYEYRIQRGLLSASVGGRLFAAQYNGNDARYPGEYVERDVMVLNTS